MKKIYTINLTRPPWHDYINEINDIKNVMPDEIIIDCTGEWDYRVVFKNLIANLQPWLAEHNKFAKILIVFDDALHVTPNIITERFLGIPVQMVYQLTQRTHIERFPITETQKLFTCYNNNPKVERARLVDQLVKEKLIDSGIVTFKYPDQVVNQTAYPFKWQYHDGSRLYDEEDFELNSKQEYLADTLPKSYFNGFIDIVTETACDEYVQYLSEKTAKPISVLKPFIVLSSLRFHQRTMSEHFGLELYTELFDYSFDDCRSERDRIDGIINNMKRLQKTLSTVESRVEMYNKIYDKLVHNRNVMLNQLEDEHRMVPPSLKCLLTEECELFGDKTNTYVFATKFLSKVRV